jgi:hypothetical protein
MGQTTTRPMRADAKALVGVRADVAPLLGTWTNTKQDTEHITRAVLTEHDGTVMVRLYGAPDEDWGETEAFPCTVTGTTDVAGFHARYTLGGSRIEIAGNVKLGVLVIQSYTTFQDDRLSHYAREFFSQTAEAPPRTADALTGGWTNTNPTTKWITSFTVTGDGEKFTMHAHSATTPTDWGEAELITYGDNIGEPALYAEYDLGTVRAVLAGNGNKGLIVIAAFLHFPGDESANHLCREFFVRRQ